MTGSDLRSEDIILKADVIYGGKRAWVLWTAPGGPIYRDVKIDLQTILRHHIGGLNNHQPVLKIVRGSWWKTNIE